jgi:hypothetical protein
MSALDRLLVAWSGPTVARLARVLVLAGAALLFLQSSATVDVVFTVRISEALLLAALVVGAPWAWRGWRTLPRWLAVNAVALLLIHVLATVFGDLAVLEGSARAGWTRAVVYLGTLGLGLGLLGLIPGLWPDRRDRRALLGALAVGGLAAGAYALYQWPAQRFGLPLTDLVTTTDSNGVTRGSAQGAGVLGWERVRGTFLEPHLLGAYLAGMVPLVLAWGMTGRAVYRRIALVGAGVMSAALLVTASVPAWFELGLAALIAGALAATACGTVRLAAACACAASIACLMAPITLAAPESAAALTGRGATSMMTTARFRTDAWDQAAHIWATRPVLGYGVGQSSVRAAIAGAGVDASVLPSAQGLWAASLVDVGVLGLAAWVVLLGGIVTLLARDVWRRPGAENTLVLAGVLAACLSTAVSGDRVELRVWLVLALALAIACSPSRRSEAVGELVAEPPVRLPLPH